MSVLNGALPAFAPEGGIWLALIRGLLAAGLFSAFGSALFRRVILPRAPAGGEPPGLAPALPDRLGSLTLASLTLASLALAGLALAAWLLAEARAMSGAADLSGAASALPVVIATTSFGHLVCLQGLFLALAALAARRPSRQLAACLVALLLQAGHSHAFSMTPGPSLLLVSDCLHLLAGAAWLGGLLPLLLTVLSASPAVAAESSRRFSPLGSLCVAAIVVTAAFQGWVLIGSIPGLVGTAYGWMAILKALLLALAIGLACANRFRFTPALRGLHPQRARRLLLASIGLETLVGLALLLAAGTLADLPPAMHDQPVWPFTQQFSLVTIDEDDSFRREAILALTALAVAAMLLLATPLLRRWMRWASLALSAGIAALAIPHLDLLLIEANPTSFYRSPTGFAADTIAEGAALFPGHCAACHGARGRGDGTLAASLPVPPADLTAPHLWMHSDGEMFWWLTHGIEAPTGGLAMPGFADRLTAEQRWALIDYVRANNAGLSRDAAGAWAQPIKAPAFAARCDGRNLSSDALHGRAVLLVTRGAAQAAMPDLVTCIADDESVARGYAIVSGAPDAREFLIDGNGWLRAATGSADGFDPRQKRRALTPLPRSGPAPSMSMPMQPGMKMDMPM